MWRENTAEHCRSELARDGGVSVTIDFTDTPPSRAGSLLQGFFGVPSGRVTGDFADALVQRLELSIHAQVDLFVQSLIDLLRLGLRHEYRTDPCHGLSLIHI